MAILDIFSKRIKKIRSENVDTYTYDNFPRKLRVQIIHILNEALGNELQYKDSYTKVGGAYAFIVKALSREYGVFNLVDDDPNSNSHRHHYRELNNFILGEQDTEKVIDAVEFSFHVINKSTRYFEYFSERYYEERADLAIDELNKRFLEHGVGYQFENDQIIRVDSKFIHAEVVKPIFVLLKDKHFAGAEDEFLKAHDHLRHHRNKEAIAECLKSFESVLKGICDKNKWSYGGNSTASKLIEIICEKKLIPAYLQSEFTSLRGILESGIPTVRNKVGGHGQGAEKIDVPYYLVAYALHLTAASILFLIECDKNLKREK